MKTIGFDKPLYILPFDHPGSFETKMFGWHGELNAAQTEEIAAAKQVIYDGFKAAIAAGVPKGKAGILVDEQFGSAILRDARANKLRGTDVGISDRLVMDLPSFTNYARQ
jgi:myo-inositol catabolism protein IolC